MLCVVRDNTAAEHEAIPIGRAEQTGRAAAGESFVRQSQGISHSHAEQCTRQPLAKRSTRRHGGTVSGSNSTRFGRALVRILLRRYSKFRWRSSMN